MLYLLQDHAPLKVPSHGSKFKKLSKVKIPNKVKMIVAYVGLLSLVDCSLSMIEASVMSDFSE